MSSNNLSKSIITSCFLAGCLEMYDFAIFGFLSSTLHKNYLSFVDTTNSLNGLIITYALFAVGFLFRPLGSIIFGYIGDVYGRKPALVLSVTLMGLASLGMCLLPSYETIGISACYAIALIRAVQGISVGGEYNGAILYAVEHSSTKNVGLVGAIVTAGCLLGVLLATFVSKILQNPALPSYSWRFAFLIGFSLSIIGYVIRKKLKETPIFNLRSIDNKIENKGMPLLKSIGFLKTEFLAAFLLAAANNANFYFLMIFVPNYLKSKSSFDLTNLGLIITILMLILVPFFGYLSDRLSRVKLLAGAFFIIAIYNLMFLDCMLSASSTVTVILYAMISAVIVAMTVSLVNVFVVEIFPTEYRFSNAALSYSLGVAALGGTVPMVAAWIAKNFGDAPSYIEYYMSLVSILGLIGSLLIIKKQKNNSIEKHKNNFIEGKVNFS